MNIFEISEKQKRLNAILEENGGEITEELENELIINEDNFNDKIQDYIYTILKYKAEEESISSEIDRLTKLKKTAQKTQENLKSRVESAMIVFGRERLKYDKFSLSLRKSSKVKILDDTLINDKYFIIKKELAKSIIKEDLKKGIKVDGAIIEENLNLSIR